MGAGAEGHGHRQGDDHIGSDAANGLGGLIKQREEGRSRHHRQPQKDAEGAGEGDHFGGGGLGLFYLARPQLVAHDDGNGSAHRHINDADEIKEGGGNVLRRYHVKPTGGIALIAEGHRQGPHQLVEHQGKAPQRNADEKRLVHLFDGGLVYHADPFDEEAQCHQNEDGKDHLKGYEKALHVYLLM